VILVDSSVWVAFLRGIETPQALKMKSGIAELDLIIGDLILAEVLQGYASQREFDFVLAYLSVLPTITIGGRAVAIEAASNYRRLRERGITVRKTIDCLIATRCILDDLQLLHADRDFDPFEAHLGLRVVR
jgi:predicted nucleic acid-binding protein